MTDEVLSSVLAWNNDRCRAADPVTDNPRPLGDLAWHQRLAAAQPRIAGEWRRFADAGGSTPLIEDVLTESQGNIGDWHLGLLVSAGRPSDLGRAAFPATLRVLAGIPHLRHAMFSVLAPGASIPLHHGPNAGVLRYHLGIDCGDASSLRIGDIEVTYRDGEAVLFDDTALHSARNDGSADRVTLFLEMLRPLPPLAQLRNRGVQRVLSLDPRYRGAVDRANALQADLGRR